MPANSRMRQWRPTAGKHVRGKKGLVGHNAEAGECEDLLKAGVIAPTRVTRSALQNAASITDVILTTEVLIADKPAASAGAHVFLCRAYASKFSLEQFLEVVLLERSCSSLSSH